MVSLNWTCQRRVKRLWDVKTNKPLSWGEKEKEKKEL